MHRTALAFALLGLLAVVDTALAQACIQDRYGRIICGKSVGPYYGQMPSPYYGPRDQRNPQASQYPGATVPPPVVRNDKRYRYYYY